ncbi:MAG: hypothetical protein ACUVRZ_00305 [Desulfobacca sp.]|uniref:hypothetical protein n=1 Tax=Desulfobacca sp. TaxID=2067990 RepID=UPI00404B38F3
MLPGLGPFIFLRLSCILFTLVFLLAGGCRPKVAPPPVVREEVPPPVAIIPGPAPSLVQPDAAPKLAALLKEVALRYDPGMTQEDRDRDFAEKIAHARQALRLERLLAMRERSLDLIYSKGGEISWEYFRRQKWPDGTPAGVTLKVPVWIPNSARPVPTYAALAETWEEVATAKPRRAGWVYFASNLQDINDKSRYRTAHLALEINSLHAPLAALLLEYIYREGVYEPNKRVPLLVVRGGEDTYAAAADSGPVSVEGLSFADEVGGDLHAAKVRLTYPSLADIHHGRHVKASNHRLGCALDINDFNFKGLVDGVPNQVSASLRHYNRDGMHQLDARNLPAWVFVAAKQVGYRIPQEWNYIGASKDWPHFDCGTK